MRGKGVWIINKVHDLGITPAYAGKSFHVKNNFVNIKDPPRLCGEKFCSIYCEFMNLGSPPPMRGKVDEIYESLLRCRITPAYAGKR